MFKKIIQCPSCRFANRVGEKRCIICKHELPAGELEASAPAPSTAGPAAAAPPAGTKPGERKAVARVGGVIPILVDPLAKKPAATTPAAGNRSPSPASNAAANARLASVRPNAPKPPVREGSPTSQTQRFKAPEAAKEAAPKPLTSRIVKGGDRTVAWLVCEPLSPIPLGGQREVTVGRHEKCDLVLPHKEVSRHHASFKVTGRQITLEDQGSSNGCYVNGKRCANQIVKVGDVITIGPYELELRASGTVTPGHQDDTKSFEMTSLAKAAPGASMTGKLEDVPLSEILQQIDFNKKTCTLLIAAPTHERGVVVFAYGKPITATFGNERDEVAIRSMLKLAAGRFVVSTEVEPAEATMNVTVTALLLESSREIDEAARPLAVVEPASSDTDTVAARPVEAGPVAPVSEASGGAVPATAAVEPVEAPPADAFPAPAEEGAGEGAVPPTRSYEPAEGPGAPDHPDVSPAQDAAAAHDISRMPASTDASTLPAPQETSAREDVGAAPQAVETSVTRDAGGSVAPDEPRRAAPFPGDAPTELSLPVVDERELEAYEQSLLSQVGGSSGLDGDPVSGPSQDAGDASGAPASGPSRDTDAASAAAVDASDLRPSGEPSAPAEPAAPNEAPPD